MYPNIMNDKFVSVLIENKSYTVMAYEPNFQGVIDAIKANDESKVRQFVDKTIAIKEQTNGVVTVKNGKVMYYGEELHNSLTTRIIKMLNGGFDINPLLLFLENLMKNPSRTAVTELYDFLETGEMPITSDGCFLAYKRIRGDYMDIYTGTIDNSIGKKPAMPRNQVDDNRNNHCSVGLHFCSLRYLPSYGANDTGNRVVIVKINPADVVSIPSDYSNTKGRCWTYEVIGEYNGPDTKEAFTKPVDDGKDFKPASSVNQESAGGTRREQAINIIAQTIGSYLDELEFTVDYVNNALSDETARNEAIDAMVSVMGISRKTAVEYYRKLKADVTNKLIAE